MRGLNVSPVGRIPDKSEIQIYLASEYINIFQIGIWGRNKNTAVKLKELSIYIHIPFCKSRCNYCSFYSLPISEPFPAPAKTIQSAAKKSLKFNPSYFEIYDSFIIKEAGLISEEFSLEGSRINSIYFGGGTPSVMPADFFRNILENVERNFEIADNAEITVEINPESGSFAKLSDLKPLGINRLSIGAQSFNGGVLKTAGRIHDEKDIYNSVNNARRAGFNNISLDLIIGLPGQTENIFYDDARRISDAGTEHISAYMLGIEKGTKFYEIYNKKKGSGFISEENTAEYYEILCGLLAENSYARYEISNFAKDGYESRHNLNYWKRGEYLGFGPSASSFLKLGSGKEIRKTNTADLKKYIQNISKKFHCEGNDNKGIEQNNGDFIEILTDKDKINEEIFLSLRTASGINAKRLSELTGREIIDKFIKEGFMQNSKENIILTLKGALLSSEIFARIMI